MKQHSYVHMKKNVKNDTFGPYVDYFCQKRCLIQSAHTDLKSIYACPAHNSLNLSRFLLFICYINDVASAASEGSDLNLFADDISLYSQKSCQVSSRL